MARVPDTNTFSLQDVVNVVNPATGDLIDCYTNSVAEYFDSRYSGDKNSLYNFRNYGFDPTTSTTTTTTSTSTSTSTSTTTSTTTTTTTTTSTTTTLPPLDFTIGSNCGYYPDTLSISSNNYVGGSGVYYAGNGVFNSEAEALSNTNWILVNSFYLGITPANGTYWLVIKDSLGNMKAKSVNVSCFPAPSTTTTSTTSTSTTSTTSTSTTSTSTSTTTQPPVGCGSSTSYSGGITYPSTKVVMLGVDTGTVIFKYNALSVPDRFIVYWNDNVVIDTGYVGSSLYDYQQPNRRTFTSALNGKTDPITGHVYPNMTDYPDDGYPRIVGSGVGSSSFDKILQSPYEGYVYVYAPINGTQWSFKMNCPGVTTTTTTTTKAPTTTTTTTIFQRQAVQYYGYSSTSKGLAYTNAQNAGWIVQGTIYLDSRDGMAYTTNVGTTKASAGWYQTYNTSAYEGYEINGSALYSYYLTAIPTTTTTTTTKPPVSFSISYTCTGGNATITISGFAGGSGVYEANTSPQTSIGNAFSGTFMTVSGSYNYTGIANGTWYIVVRDKNNTINGTYQVITFNCTTTTTTTTTTVAPTTTTTAAPTVWILEDCSTLLNYSVAYTTLISVGNVYSFTYNSVAHCGVVIGTGTGSPDSTLRSTVARGGCDDPRCPAPF